MKLHHRWEGKGSDRGFTLIEMLLVLGITTLLGVAGMSFGVSTLSRSFCAVEFDRVRTLLFHARNQALVNRSSIVVHLESGRFLLAPSDVTFLPFTGVEGSETIVSITGPACNTTITINNVGAILW